MYSSIVVSTSVPLDLHKSTSHAASNAVTIIPSGSKGIVTVSLPPLNSKEGPVPLELWPALYSPTSMQISVPDSKAS